MPVWSDMNGFPEGGFPVLANDMDMITLGQLNLYPLKNNNYIIDVLGNNRLLGTLTINGALSGCAGIAAGGAITGATTIAANNTVTLSSATAPLTLSGENANILMSGLNSSIGTVLQKVKNIFAKKITLDERPTVGEDVVALVSDIPKGATDTGVTAGTNDTKFITPKAFADSSIKANHDWMLNLMQGNANGIDTDVVDATIVVFFEGEMMQISYSNLLAQLQSDLGL